MNVDPARHCELIVRQIRDQLAEPGRLYLAVILDLLSRRVGDALSDRDDTQLARATLKAAIR
jgi:hypothetical protein